MLDSGKPVTYFQSYNSIIVRIEGSAVVLDCNKWDYSPTTSKYRNIFLGETTKKTRAKIKSGKYVLSDLNYPPWIRPACQVQRLAAVLTETIL